MSTDLVASRPMSVPVGQEVDALERIAQNLASAGIYRKTAKTPVEVFAILLAARDMGVAPTSALAGGIHMVDGKPEVSANLQAQLLREYRGPEGQRYDFRILTPARDRSKECELEFRRFWPGEQKWEAGDPIGSEFFSLDNATTAGLAGKDVWKKYPKMMLIARCLSDGIASHCPETARGLRVYGEGEIGGPDPVAPVGAPVQPPAPDVPAAAAPEDAVVMVEGSAVDAIVDRADTLGLLGTLQAAASHVAGRDVGDCATRENATTAISSLTGVEAFRVAEWLRRKGVAQEAEATTATPPGPRTDPVTFDDVITEDAAA
jgi:hypothetical protein